MALFTGQINVQARASRSDPGALASRIDSINYTISQALDLGTGVDQARYMLTTTGYVDNLSGESIILTGIENALGEAIDFTTIRALIIENHAEAADAVLRVSIPGAVAHVSDLIMVRPGGLLVLLAPRDGYAVGVSGQINTDTLGAGAITYSLIIIGE